MSYNKTNKQTNKQNSHTKHPKNQTKRTKKINNNKKKADSDFYTNANYNLKVNKEPLFPCARTKEILFISDYFPLLSPIGCRESESSLDLKKKFPFFFP